MKAGEVVVRTATRDDLANIKRLYAELNPDDEVLERELAAKPISRF